MVCLSKEQLTTVHCERCNIEYQFHLAIKFLLFWIVVKCLVKLDLAEKII